MQSNTFVGNLAKAPTLTGNDERAVCKFTLISNEYAGKDRETGEARERSVAIPFTAFRSQATVIARNLAKGDQLIVTYRIENNNYEKDGETHYGFSFVVEEFQFGAPGKEKREQFARGSE